MTQAAFDTLAYARKLENVGFTREQSEVQAEALRHFMDNQVATKHDLRETELRLQKEIKDTELRLQKEIKDTELRLQKEIQETELRLQKEIKDTALHIHQDNHQTEMRLLKWQIGGWIALAAIMAKGFGWLGF